MLKREFFQLLARENGTWSFFSEHRAFFEVIAADFRTAEDILLVKMEHGAFFQNILRARTPIEPVFIGFYPLAAEREAFRHDYQDFL